MRRKSSAGMDPGWPDSSAMCRRSLQEGGHRERPVLHAASGVGPGRSGVRPAAANGALPDLRLAAAGKRLHPMAGLAALPGRRPRGRGRGLVPARPRAGGGRAARTGPVHELQRPARGGERARALARGRRAADRQRQSRLEPRPRIVVRDIRRLAAVRRCGPSLVQPTEMGHPIRLSVRSTLRGTRQHLCARAP